MSEIKFVTECDREGTVRVVDDVCNLCGETTRVLTVDITEGELPPSRICRECIENLFIEEHLR